MKSGALWRKEKAVVKTNESQQGDVYLTLSLSLLIVFRWIRCEFGKIEADRRDTTS